MEGANVRDDVVSYEVYHDNPDAVNLDTFRDQCLAAAAEWTAGYIWQQDGFCLHSSNEQPKPFSPTFGGLARGPCLWGEACFGDNIEDEWLIVWLLVELSRLHKISVRVWDSDGDFLLIHAAYTLPKWVKPDVVENRVWIRDGRIHLIPLPSALNPQLPAQPSLPQSLQILQSDVNTIAPTTLQACIAAKLADFPQKIRTNIHQAAAVIPTRLASALQQDPQLLAPAVQSFYYRDPEDLKAARSMAHFPHDCETAATVVTFNRCLYAQMVTQQYQPPRSVILPLPSDPTYSAVMLGHKITAGFEMLLASLSHRQPGADPVSVLTASKRLRPQWEGFLKRMETAGFFCGEMEGSSKYKQLLARAADIFHASLTRNSMNPTERDPALRCAKILAQNRPFDPSKVELERELKQREAETNETLSSEFKSFLETDTEVEGITSMQELLTKFSKLSDEDKAVDFDTESFVREMQRAFDMGSAKEDDSSEEGSSFYGDSGDQGDPQSVEDVDWLDQMDLRDFSEIDSILNNKQPFSNQPHSQPKSRPPAAAASKADAKRKLATVLDADRPDVRWKDTTNPQEDWDAQTATDSDDENAEERDAFDQAYEEVLRAGYRENQPHNGTSEGEGTGDDLTPVDLDMNLVQNLLSSYQAQQGLPGPVSNLAGMLGLNFGGDLESMQS